LRTLTKVKKLKNRLIPSSARQPVHLVDRSPWPFCTAVNVSLLLLTFVSSFGHILPFGGKQFWPMFCLWPWFGLAWCVYNWLENIIVESTYLGNHTKIVVSGLRMGFKLFIVSEVMLFFSFFLALFYCALWPSIWIGGVWPSKDTQTPNPWSIPLLNTCILLTSGFALTVAHKALIARHRGLVIYSLLLTVLLGINFTFLQWFEYQHIIFSMNDGIYASIFFLATGFHGAHVLAGTCYLIVCFFRQLNYHFLQSQHVGFETAAWYWHFVDVVWIFLWVWLYVWSQGN